MVWAAAVVSEVSKGDMPPANPFYLNDPLHYSIGVKHVFVNGKPVLLDAKITGERPGRALRGPGYKGQ